MNPSLNRPSLALLLALAAALGLAISNPGLMDYEAFAAERLVGEIADELCLEADLPLMARLVLANCPQLLRQQRAPLAALLRRQTRRTDLGLVSLFRSELGGERLFDWRLPRVRALVLGVAGQFVVLHAEHDGRQSVASASDGEDPWTTLGWLRP